MLWPTRCARGHGVKVSIVFGFGSQISGVEMVIWRAVKGVGPGLDFICGGRILTAVI